MTNKGSKAMDCLFELSGLQWILICWFGWGFLISIGDGR